MMPSPTMKVPSAYEIDLTDSEHHTQCIAIRKAAVNTKMFEGKPGVFRRGPIGPASNLCPC